MGGGSDGSAAWRRRLFCHVDVAGSAASGGSEQAVPCKDVIGEGKPAHHRKDLGVATKHKLAQTPIAEAGVDAFPWRSAFVDALAVRALHSLAPSCHSGAVIAARRIGIR